jgi:hypothetical protein
LIEHIEQEISGKAVQTLKKTCAKLHKQCSKEEKTDHSTYSQVLPKLLLMSYVNVLVDYHEIKKRMKSERI